MVAADMASHVASTSRVHVVGVGSSSISLGLFARTDQSDHRRVEQKMALCSGKHVRKLPRLPCELTLGGAGFGTSADRPTSFQPWGPTGIKQAQKNTVGEGLRSFSAACNTNSLSSGGPKEVFLFTAASRQRYLGTRSKTSDEAMYSPFGSLFTK